MLTFTLPPFTSQVDFISGEKKGDFEIYRFKNGELHVELLSDVQDQVCCILGSLAPPDEQFLQLVSLAHTLKKNMAKKCIAILPYLGYARQEHLEKNHSQLADLIYKMVEKSGIDQILAFDIHSKVAKQLFSIPVIEIQSAPIFAKYLERRRFDCCISPDFGGIERSLRIANLMNISNRGHCVKVRKKNGVTTVELIGEVGKSALVVDDMIDTGDTMQGCLEQLQKSGVKSIVIAACHPVFSEDRLDLFATLGVEEVICLDTIPVKPQIEKNKLFKLLPSFLDMQEVLWNNL